MQFTFFKAPNHGFFPLYDEKNIVPGPVAKCSSDSEHCVEEFRTNQLHLILPSVKVPPIFWTWWSECVLTEPVVELFDKLGLTGFRLEPVFATGVRHGSKDLSVVPRLYEMIVTGWGGMASPESGLKLVKKCPGCGRTEYAGIVHPEKLIDDRYWDGSDFFIIWPMPKYTILSERAAAALKQHKLRQFKLLKPSELSFVWGHFVPGTLREHFGEELAKKLGKPWGLK